MFLAITEVSANEPSCSDLIYFCSLDSPYCNLTELSINQFIEEKTCVKVTKYILPSFLNLSNDELALKYKLDHVPAFVFIERDGCFGEIGNAGNTKLEDIKYGVNNFKCNSSTKSPCTDSDGGLDYYLFGIAKGPNNAYAPDFCINYDDLGVIEYEKLKLNGGKTGVIEHYCDSHGYVANEGFDCPKGCLNGACLGEEIIPREITNMSVSESYFRKSYFKCSDGRESYEGGESSCESYGLWKDHALSFCGSQFGDVVAFSMSDECYFTGIPPIEQPINPEPYVFPNATICKLDSDCPQLSIFSEDDGPTFPIYKCVNNYCVAPLDGIGEANDSISLICKNSCPLDDKCYPFGYRKFDKYCSDSGSFLVQFGADKTCDNNFECGSNVCVSGKCVSEGLLEKVLNWFKSLLG